MFMFGALHTSAKLGDASKVCVAPAANAVFHSVCTSSPRVWPSLLSGPAAMRVVVVR